MELSKYEKARVISARALQLSAGAPPAVKTEPDYTFVRVAENELEKGVTPLIVLREREH